MPNGKPSDHPLTDLLFHGIHVFPPDMEKMILQLHEADKSVFEEPEAFGMLFEWELGKNLEKGRAWLRERLDDIIGG